MSQLRSQPQERCDWAQNRTSTRAHDYIRAFQDVYPNVVVTPWFFLSTIVLTSALPDSNIQTLH